MRKILCNRRGAGHIDTAMKVIIGVVIGALILGGLYLLVAGEDGVIGKASTEVGAMLDYTQELRVERAYNEDSGQYYLRYSYDGKHWSNSEVPNYGDTATVYGILSNNSESNPIEIALMQEGTKYYVLASTDGGISWSEKLTFTAAGGITHFYYGTDAQLPVDAPSFSGERFVIRYCSGGSTYFTKTSTGLSWSSGGWSDLIRP
ncbi:MAG: hypothetical protein IKC59_07350 [Clostridia bacterium]|nr:hypothetical protein [Clostridia bacterium]